MQALLEWDERLFLWLRDVTQGPLGDAVFPWITDIDHFRIPLLALWLLIMIFGGSRGRRLGILLVVTLLLTDQLSASVLKPWVQRTRPCFAIESVQTLISQSRSPSFPSSHATNLFGAAALLGLRLGRWGWLALVPAALVAFSRIYVGVHYPLDALGGACLGFGTACLVTGCLASIGLRRGPRKP